MNAKIYNEYEVWTKQQQKKTDERILRTTIEKKKEKRKKKSNIYIIKKTQKQVYLLNDLYSGSFLQSVLTISQCPDGTLLV